MSWRLARSFANSLLLDENDAASTTQQQQQQDQNVFVDLQSDGVKEDLTELKQTLARQFWGVASVLAPPPDGSQSQPLDDPIADAAEPSDWDRHDCDEGNDVFEEGKDDVIEEGNLGIDRGEHEEVEGFDDECEDEEFGVEEAVGMTDEVLAFALNIAHHPETWLDFPLDPDDDLDDFEMSDEQRKHAMAIELLAPRLAALRIELCPCHMNDSYFWKVYFVLLHSRLSKQDAEILSTPQVMAARAMWMQELQKKTKPETDWWGGNSSWKDSEVEDDLVPVSPHYIYSENVTSHSFSSEQSTTLKTIDHEIEKHPVESSEVKYIDKSVIQETPVIKTGDKDLCVTSSSKVLLQSYEDDEDDWPDEDSDLGGYSRTTVPLGDEDDISFSDLEDDDDLSKIILRNHKS